MERKSRPEKVVTESSGGRKTTEGLLFTIWRICRPGKKGGYEKQTLLRIGSDSMLEGRPSYR